MCCNWEPQSGTPHTLGGRQNKWHTCRACLGWLFNSLRPKLNLRYFADSIFKCNFLFENVWIPIKFLLAFVPKGPINNIPALVQIMAWRGSGDKPLSEPMMVRLPTHICVTWPQWIMVLFTYLPFINISAFAKESHRSVESCSYSRSLATWAVARLVSESDICKVDVISIILYDD